MSSLEILNMLNQKSQHQEYDIGKKGKRFHISGSMIHQCNCIKINTNKNVFYTFLHKSGFKQPSVNALRSYSF